MSRREPPWIPPQGFAARYSSPIMDDRREIRLGALLAELSYALDLAEGQAAGHALRACLIGMTLAERAGLGAVERSELYYAHLLKDAGCSSNASRIAALLEADDQTVKRALKLTDWTRFHDRLRYASRVVAPGAPTGERLKRLAMLARRPDTQSVFTRLRCERGAEIAAGLGFPDGTSDAIRCLDEHWDGKGHPKGLKGEEIPRAARIMCLAQTVDVFMTANGIHGAVGVAHERRGTWFEPALVDLLDAEMLHALPVTHDELEAAVTAHEPAELVLVGDDERVGRVADAFAGLIDAKSPSTAGHSHRVAALVVAAADQLGEPAGRDVERAALLHDIGKLSLSSRLLDKPGRLTPPEWAAVRAHPLHTERLLSRVAPLRPVASIAAAHHERLDGSGYPHGLTGDELGLPARLLAVADVYEAITAARPYRAPLRPAAAKAHLRDEARAGRLDEDCVEALAASQPARR
jgi:HD-GYP domain-containing protein (c-di-GMP phosphodiesterase class II)